MDITVNSILEWIIDGEVKMERILWVGQDIAYVIELGSNRMPYARLVSEIKEALLEGRVNISDEDPYMVIAYDEELPVKHIEKRDRAWGIIKEIVADEPKVFESTHRRQLIKEKAKLHGVSENTIVKYLKKYWQRGKTPNALLPDYFLCGGRGKEKAAGTAKRGRPRKFTDVAGVGINVTEDIKKIFRIAVNRFYYTTAKNSLVLTYELMRKEYFSNDYRIENGVKVPIIRPQSEVPTFGQFYYWFTKERNIKREISSRYGNKKYQKQYRPIVGSAMDGVIQPGVFEIDCQVADVYLVSRFNRNWIIGRPAVYAVIDKFSRLVCGIYVGLESGSYIGAAMALLNAVSDKVEFCRQYGIEIREEDWPVHHLPEVIVADRGELAGGNIEALVNILNVKVQNTPPYRADLKSIIERFFGLTNERVKPFLPGAINLDGRERGDRDYRLDAKLDLYQFTQIIIRSVLFHNNNYYLENYRREEAMIEDNVPCIPIELFRWGIANRGGMLRTVSEDVAKLALMPTDSAVVTPKGIKFRDMYYASASLLRSQTFIKARSRGTWKVKISYDPRNLDYIYVHGDTIGSFEKCFLIDANSRYKGKTLEEIDYLLEMERLEQTKNRDTVAQAKTQLISQVENIVKQAEDDYIKETAGTESGRQRVKNIRQNRKLEKEISRKNEAFELNRQERPVDFRDDIYKETERQEDYGFKLLLRKQKEGLYGRNNNDN